MLQDKIGEALKEIAGF
jgi:dynein heavy chain, axonemal